MGRETDLKTRPSTPDKHLSFHKCVIITNCQGAKGKLLFTQKPYVIVVHLINKSVKTPTSLSTAINMGTVLFTPRASLGGHTPAVPALRGLEQRAFSRPRLR